MKMKQLQDYIFSKGYTPYWYLADYDTIKEIRLRVSGKEQSGEEVFIPCGNCPVDNIPLSVIERIDNSCESLN